MHDVARCETYVLRHACEGRLREAGGLSDEWRRVCECVDHDLCRLGRCSESSQNLTQMCSEVADGVVSDVCALGRALCVRGRLLSLVHRFRYATEYCTRLRASCAVCVWSENRRSDER